MTIHFSSKDFDELDQESQQNGEISYCLSEFESIEKRPKWRGRGHNRFIQLRNGLDMRISDGEFWQPLSRDNQHGEFTSFGTPAG